MKTFTLKQKDIKKNWFIIDAENVVLGRLASFASAILRGKHKTNFTPHLDCGDNLIIINAKKVKLKGKKIKEKLYYRHTGYPGGIKSENAEEILQGKKPEKVLTLAIKRMLKNNPLSRKQLSNLRIFPDNKHSLEAQQPKRIDFINLNKKNS